MIDKNKKKEEILSIVPFGCEETRLFSLADFYKHIDEIYDSMGRCLDCERVSIEEYEEGQIYHCQANDFETEQPETFFCSYFSKANS